MSGALGMKDLRVSTEEIADVAVGHLRVLAARPRPTGSAAEAAALHYCKSVLESIGFVTVERPFEYSRFPGQYGTPLGGALMLIALILSAVFGAARQPGTVLVILVAALLVT